MTDQKPVRLFHFLPWACVSLMLWGLICFAVTACLGGCVPFHDMATGRIGVGVGLGTIADTANQAGSTLLTTLGIGAGPAGAIALLAGKFYADARAAAAAHTGENAGWDAREKAASTQQPLTPPAVAASAAPVIPSTPSESKA